MNKLIHGVTLMAMTSPADTSPEHEPFILSQLSPEPPRKRRTGLIIAAIVGVIVLAALAATLVMALRPGGSPLAPPSTLRVYGTLTVHGADSCLNMSSGYDDIRPGAQVTVTDQTGAVVAIGELGLAESMGDGCRFDLAVAKVPAGRAFYGIEVAHRGKVQFTEAQLRTKVQLSLG